MADIIDFRENTRVGLFIRWSFFLFTGQRTRAL